MALNTVEMNNIVREMLCVTVSLQSNKIVKH